MAFEWGRSACGSRGMNEPRNVEKWMAIEFLRGSLLFDGYPWLLAAHPLIEFAPMAMPARTVPM